jgi:alpha-beta hydrolase superfamily lysophospholipase
MLPKSRQPNGRRGSNRDAIKNSVALIACLIGCVCSDLIFTSTSVRAQEREPDLNITAVEDGAISKAFHLPSYEWFPADKPPVGLILAVHGLTLHAKRYEVLCKAFAAAGFYACACDMRGFGRCYTDDQHKFCVGNDCKRKVDFQKSYLDLVDVATRLKKDHPGLPLFALGESMGTSLCIKLAADHPELVDGLILSGPTVKVHPLMFFHPSNILAGGIAIFIDPKFNVNMKGFVNNLVSNDPNIVKEMLDDPLCRKSLTIADLLKTAKFAKSTLRNAQRIKENEHILVIQDSQDLCMVPHAVTALSKRIHSSDQTIRWLHAHGHLLLETAYLKPATVEALSNWVEQHDAAHEAFAKSIQNEILQFGAKQ